MNAAYINSILIALIFLSLFNSTSLGEDFSNPQSASANRKTLDLNDESLLSPVPPNGSYPYSQGFQKNSDVYVCDAQNKSDAQMGVLYTYKLDQLAPTPLIATGWSKAENVGGNKDSNYSLYLDILYMDDTADWGQVYEFPVKTTDWTKGKVVIFPSKPIKSVSFYGMFRAHSGKAEFKDLTLYQYDRSIAVSYFDGNPIETPNQVACGLEPRVFIRNTAVKGDYLSIENHSNVKIEELGLSVNQSQNPLDSTRADNSLTETRFVLHNDDDRDKALSFVYALPLPSLAEEVKWEWFNSPRLSVPLENNELSKTRKQPEVGSQRSSIYPFGAVAAKNRQGEYVAAFGLGINPNYPAYYRIVANGMTNELYIVFDLALTKEKKTAELRVLPLYWQANSNSDVVSPIDQKEIIKGTVQFEPNIPYGSTPFRAAFDVYRQAFPENFFVRAIKQGNWMAFAKISNVPNWKDFGFQFKEGVDEIDKDDENGISSFRYTEPMTWWQRFENFELPGDIAESAYQIAKKEAIENSTSNDGSNGRYAERQALLTTGYRDKQGKPSGLVLDTPWCKGVVWSMNDAPGLVELAKQNKLRNEENNEVDPIAGFEIKWNEQLANKLYCPPLEPENLPKTRAELLASETAPGCDGEYIDSSEGYVTASLDYERSHFAGMKTPLTYDSETFQPAIFRGLIAFEYVKKISEDVRARGKLSMANATPQQHFWLSTQLDVLGTENNWKYDGAWRPMPDEELMYRRVICCGKPFCFLMNTNFDLFDKDDMERYMRRALAYGMFPSCFSADASTKHYFENPELYERDRDLFKLYMPIVKEVAEAGWEPQTCVLSNDPQLYVERFGALKNAKVSSNSLRPNDDVFLTLFNDSNEEKSYELTLGQALMRHIDDADATIVEQLEKKKISRQSGVISGRIPPQDVRVFKISSIQP